MSIFITLFTTSFVIALSGALMPGPMFTYTISEASKKGIWIGPLLILGHAILEFSLLILLIFGFGVILTKDITFALIGTIGAAIMLYMAYEMYMSLPKLNLHDSASHPKKITIYKNPVIAGIIISLSNPYWSIWWATIGFGYVTLSLKNGYIGVFVFFLGHIFADFIWYFFISFSITKGKSFISNRLYKIIIFICATALIYFAFTFGHAGIKKFIEIFHF